ncbi:hypothetical protein BGZ46_009648, partial [Entomortierella lignicola]
MVQQRNNEDAARYYPSPDLQGIAYDSCAPEEQQDNSHWINNLLLDPTTVSAATASLGDSNDYQSVLKFEARPHSPSSLCGEAPQSPDLSSISTTFASGSTSSTAHQGLFNVDSDNNTEKSVLSSPQSWNITPTHTTSSHTFISHDFTPSSLEEHLSDIDSDAMTFLTRPPRHGTSGSLLFSQENTVDDDDGPYCPKDYQDDESYYPEDFEGDASYYCESPHPVCDDNVVPNSYRKDGGIQTPEYDYVVPTPDLVQDITPTSTVDHQSSPTPYHGHSQYPTPMRSNFTNRFRSVESMSMEFESFYTPTILPLEYARYNDEEYHISTPDCYNDNDIEDCYMSNSSQCSSPGYVPVDINMLNPSLDPNEDRWFVNPIEFDYKMDFDFPLIPLLPLPITLVPAATFAALENSQNQIQQAYASSVSIGLSKNSTSHSNTSFSSSLGTTTPTGAAASSNANTALSDQVRLGAIVDALGQASAKAQELPTSITQTLRLAKNPTQRVYILRTGLDSGEDQWLDQLEIGSPLMIESLKKSLWDLNESSPSAIISAQEDASKRSSRSRSEEKGVYVAGMLKIGEKKLFIV